MPNHVINELIFTDLNIGEVNKLIASVYDKELDKEGKPRVNFEILVPIPLNVWKSSTNKILEGKFKQVALNWCREEWGTKWNAYDCRHKNISSGTEIGLYNVYIVFETAWSAPYPWLVALFHTMQKGFQHNWKSEGSEECYTGYFNWDSYNDYVMRGIGWKEEEATSEVADHLYTLFYGCTKAELEAQEAIEVTNEAQS